MFVRFRPASLFLFLVCACTSMAVADEAREKHDDLKRLHGVWRVKLVQPKGFRFVGKPRRVNDQIHIQLLGPSRIGELNRKPLESVNRHPWLQEHRADWQLAFAIDPLSDPPAFNVAFRANRKPQFQLGRYQLRGDRLTVRWNSKSVRSELLLASDNSSLANARDDWTNTDPFSNVNAWSGVFERTRREQVSDVSGRSNVANIGSIRLRCR